MDFKSNDLITIKNQPLTTPGKVYTVLYTQERTRTQHDPPDSPPYLQWVAYTNDPGVTDFVRSSQCELYNLPLKLEYEDYLIEFTDEYKSPLLDGIEFTLPQQNGHRTILHNMDIHPIHCYNLGIVKATKVKVTIEEII